MKTVEKLRQAFFQYAPAAILERHGIHVLFSHTWPEITPRRKDGKAFTAAQDAYIEGFANGYGAAIDAVDQPPAPFHGSLQFKDKNLYLLYVTFCKKGDTVGGGAFFLEYRNGPPACLGDALKLQEDLLAQAAETHNQFHNTNEAPTEFFITGMYRL